MKKRGDMKIKIAVFIAIGWWTSLALAQSGFFCVDDPALCADINAGDKYLGKECIVAKNTDAKNTDALTKLYDLVAIKEGTDSSQTVAQAFKKLPESFSEEETAFVAISRPVAQKYSLTISSTSENQIDLNLLVVPTPGRADRTTQKLTVPFFQIVALSGQVLEKYGIPTWDDATLVLKTTPTAKGILCTPP